MDDNGFDWGTFLRRWQDEWVPSEDEAMELEEEEGETALSDLAALGAPPASEAEVADAERRLGTRLPPSYREFLLASNGWSLRDDSIYQLGAAHEIGWFGDPFGMTPMYRENLDERSTEQEVLLAGMWQRALQLETDSDMSYVLLDPGDTDEHGEWALYVYKGWSGEYPDRYPSFRAYMQRRYESFHSERARLPEFANDTTRARDADVARAREEALSGRWEAARELLEVARRYGRPGAWGMLGQLDVLSRGVSGGGMFFGDLVADPRCADELVPVMALARVRDSRPHPGGHQFPLGAETDDAVRAAADAILAQVRDGSYRYAPGGDFGQAVAEAREAARWGTPTAHGESSGPRCPPGRRPYRNSWLRSDCWPIRCSDRWSRGSGGGSCWRRPAPDGRAWRPSRCPTSIRRGCPGSRRPSGGTPRTAPTGVCGWRAWSRRRCPVWSGRTLGPA